jgi:hypothetical protein
MKKIISVLAVFIILANTLFAQPAKRKPAPKSASNFSWGESQTQPTTKVKTNTPTRMRPDDSTSALKPKQRRKG